MPVTVQQETQQQPAIALLLRQSEILAAHLYAAESRRALTPETLDMPSISVLVAGDEEGAAPGCGADPAQARQFIHLRK